MNFLSGALTFVGSSLIAISQVTQTANVFNTEMKNSDRDVRELERVKSELDRCTSELQQLHQV
jgi:hypothetical protein